MALPSVYVPTTMPSGIYVVEVRPERPLLERLVGAVREAWPSVLVVDPARSPAFALDWASDPWGDLRLYEGLDAYVAWSRVEKLTRLGLMAAIRRGEANPLKRVLLRWTRDGLTLEVGSRDCLVALSLEGVLQENALDWESTKWAEGDVSGGLAAPRDRVYWPRGRVY